MKKQKSGGEWLDHFQSKIRNYCEKQQIALIHRVQMISILSKAWDKAFVLGYMVKLKELEKSDQLVQVRKEYIKFLHDCIDKRVEYLRVHGFDTSIEEIKTGNKLRLKIEELESSLLSENQ